MKRRLLFLLAGAHFCTDLSSGALMAVLPFLVTHAGMDYTAVAGLVFAWSFLSSIVQPFFGYLADRISQSWFMGLGVLLAGVPLGILGFTDSYWLVFMAVTLMGVGSAIFHPEAARIVNCITFEKPGTAMSVFSVGGNAGYGLGPLVGVALIHFWGLSGMLLFSVIAILKSLVLFIEMPRFSHMPSFLTEKIRLSVADCSGTASAVPENDWSSFLRLSLVVICRSIAFCGINSFLPLFCIQVLSQSDAVGCATNSVLSITSILTTLVGGRLTDRLGYVRVLRGCCWLLVPLLAVAVFSGNIWVVYLMLFPMSFAMYGPYSAMVLLGQRYLSRNIGLAAGVTLGLSFSIGGIAAPSLGRYADIFGLQSLMAMVVGIALLCGLSTLCLSEPGTENKQ